MTNQNDMGPNHSTLRPTSPPPPRRKAEEIIIHSLPPTPPLPGGVTIPDAIMALREENHKLTAARDAAEERCNNHQAKILKLNSEIYSLTERLGKHECPDCGESEQIVDCHHDGETCGVPECDYRHCNGCGHKWGHN